MRFIISFFLILACSSLSLAAASTLIPDEGTPGPTRPPAPVVKYKPVYSGGVSIPHIDNLLPADFLKRVSDIKDAIRSESTERFSKCGMQFGFPQISAMDSTVAQISLTLSCAESPQDEFVPSKEKVQKVAHYLSALLGVSVEMHIYFGAGGGATISN